MLPKRRARHISQLVVVLGLVQVADMFRSPKPRRLSNTSSKKKCLNMVGGTAGHPACHRSWSTAQAVDKKNKLHQTQACPRVAILVVKGYVLKIAYTEIHSNFTHSTTQDLLGMSFFPTFLGETSRLPRIQLADSTFFSLVLHCSSELKNLDPPEWHLQL